MFKQKVPKTFLFILGSYIVGFILVLNINTSASKYTAIIFHIILLMLTLFIWNVAFIRYYSINKKFDLILGYTYLGVFVLAGLELAGYFLDKNYMIDWADMLQRLWLAFGLIILFPKRKTSSFIAQVKENKTLPYLVFVAVIAVIGGVVANVVKHDTHSEIVEFLNIAILVALIVAFIQVYQYKKTSSEKLYSKLLFSVELMVLAQIVYVVSGDSLGTVYLYAELIEIASFSIFAYGLLMDIVDAFKYQRRARLVLVNKNKQLELIDRQKDEFVGFVSHQLRTPLTAIKWRLDFMKEEPNISKRLKDDIDEVDKSNQHLIDLVKMFLSITRLNLNRYSPQIEYFSPRQIINDILKDNEPGLVIKNLAVKVECSEKLHITNDKTAISSILDNLITNAIKYCHQDGRILIECHAIEHILQIDVTDDGIGIPKQLQANVFKPFVRLDNALKTSASGSGYGLYFVSRLVQALGGIITFESEEGKGTTFEVKLPLSLNIESEAMNESKSISSR